VQPNENAALWPCISAACQAGSQVAELVNLKFLGWLLAWLGNGDQAVTVSEAALAVAADLGMAPYKLAALHSIAFSCMRAGQYD
jgi:hypothetical protein